MTAQAPYESLTNEAVVRELEQESNYLSDRYHPPETYRALRAEVMRRMGDGVTPAPVAGWRVVDDVACVSRMFALGQRHDAETFAESLPAARVETLRAFAEKPRTDGAALAANKPAGEDRPASMYGLVNTRQAQAQGSEVQAEVVGKVCQRRGVHGDFDGFDVEWLLEGGIHAIGVDGETFLYVIDGVPVPDDGALTLYTANAGSGGSDNAAHAQAGEGSNG